MRFRQVIIYKIILKFEISHSYWETLDRHVKTETDHNDSDDTKVPDVSSIMLSKGSGRVARPVDHVLTKTIDIQPNMAGQEHLATPAFVTGLWRLRYGNIDVPDI